MIRCFIVTTMLKLSDTFSPESSNTTELVGFTTPAFATRKNAAVGRYSGGSLIDALNAFSAQNNHRVLNRDGHDINLFVNDKNTKFLTLKSQVLILPEFSSGGSISFSGWYTDEYFKKPFQSH